ncbi:MAG: hypothetical protein LBE56_14360 [Tannerella sp.]|nr:hypothetical protein [Tannerella sp.]
MVRRRHSTPCQGIIAGSKNLQRPDRSMAGLKYIAYDWTKVDRANRTVIDFVLNI